MQENDCEYIRFFGKNFVINSDYYIIQGWQRKFPPSEGTNKYTFWVSDSLLDKWTELPDITHEQLVVSRKFNKENILCFV